MSNIAVIGSGVIGLSTAIMLRKRGYLANIYTIDLSDKTIPSYSACALWMPFLMSDDKHAHKQTADSRYWAEFSWAYFEKISKLNTKTGIFKVAHEEYWDEYESEPYYYDIVDNFSIEHSENDLPYKYKWTMNTFVIDMTNYMDWLLQEFKSLNGKIFSSSDGWDYKNMKNNVFFNCTGISSREIFKDTNLKGVKGHLVVCDATQQQYSMGDNEYCVIPRSNNLLIGSLMIESEEYTIDINGIEHLSKKTKKLMSSNLGKKLGIDKININDENLIITGIRPYRENGVRLEYEKIKDKSIYHNYGHGGGGVTFSWGCVQDSINLFENKVDADMNLINKDRITKSKSDISIEIAHIELEDVKRNHQKVNQIIKDSAKIAIKLKRIFAQNNITYNTIVLVDDKSVNHSKLDTLLLEKFIEKLKNIGVDYLVYESSLKKYALKMKKILPERYGKRFDIVHGEFGCKEDIITWYSLRLGLINIEENDIKVLSDFDTHHPYPVISKRLITVLPKYLKGTEDLAYATITKSFGNDIASLCEKIYF